MRKLFIAFILIFMCFGAFSETLEGTWGFKFGMNKDEVVKLCTDKGMTVWFSDDTIVKTFVPEGVTYANIPITHCEFNITNGSLWKIKFEQSPKNGNVDKWNENQLVKNAVNMIIDKYKLKGAVVFGYYELYDPEKKSIKVVAHSYKTYDITFSDDSYKTSVMSDI